MFICVARIIELEELTALEAEGLRLTLQVAIVALRKVRILDVLNEVGDEEPFAVAMLCRAETLHRILTHSVQAYGEDAAV